ncbi:MAG: tetratricopeptide repeat protein [Spirochaetales bacterium]|jgi:cytochrome c-type biogenesis protein CcmH/NrfG|nr:tetratricopeptide repeat protein [Spirochaetales bacterium]
MKDENTQELILEAAGRGDYAAVEKAARSILEKNPASLGALRLLGYACIYTGRTDEGREFFIKALEASPVQTGIRLEAARALKNTGEYDGALLQVESFLEEDVANPQAMSLYGEILLAAGRTDEALDHFLEAYEQFPDSPEIMINLSRIYQEMGRKEIALETVDMLLNMQEALAPPEEVARLEELYAKTARAMEKGAADMWRAALDELEKTLAPPLPSSGEEEEELSGIGSISSLFAVQKKPEPAQPQKKAPAKKKPAAGEKKPAKKGKKAAKTETAKKETSEEPPAGKTAESPAESPKSPPPEEEAKPTAFEQPLAEAEFPLEDDRVSIDIEYEIETENEEETAETQIVEPEAAPEIEIEAPPGINELAGLEDGDEAVSEPENETPQPEIEAEGEGETTESETEPLPESEIEPEPEGEAEPETPETEPESEIDAGIEAQAPEPEGEPAEESEPETPEPETEPEPASEPETETGAESETPEPEIEPEDAEEEEPETQDSSVALLDYLLSLAAALPKKKRDAFKKSGYEKRAKALKKKLLELGRK